MEEGDRRACFDKGWEAVGIARQNIAVRRRVDNRLKEGMKWKVAHLGSVEHKIGLQFNLRWSIFLNISVAVDWIGTAAQAVHRRIKLQNRSGNGTWPSLPAWYFEFAEIEEQFEVNLFQGLVQVLAVKQKKRRSEDISSSANYNPGRG